MTTYIHARDRKLLADGHWSGGVGCSLMMSCKEIFINAWVGIKLSCFVALMGHFTKTVYDKVIPESTIAITEKIKLLVAGCLPFLLI